MGVQKCRHPCGAQSGHFSSATRRCNKTSAHDLGAHRAPAPAAAETYAQPHVPEQEGRWGQRGAVTKTDNQLPTHAAAGTRKTMQAEAQQKTPRPSIFKRLEAQSCSTPQPHRTLSSVHPQTLSAADPDTQKIGPHSPRLQAGTGPSLCEHGCALTHTLTGRRDRDRVAPSGVGCGTGCRMSGGPDAAALCRKLGSLGARVTPAPAVRAQHQPRQPPHGDRTPAPDSSLAHRPRAQGFLEPQTGGETPRPKPGAGSLEWLRCASGSRRDPRSLPGPPAGGGLRLCLRLRGSAKGSAEAEHPSHRLVPLSPPARNFHVGSPLHGGGTQNPTEQGNTGRG